MGYLNEALHMYACTNFIMFIAYATVSTGHVPYKISYAYLCTSTCGVSENRRTACRVKLGESLFLIVQDVMCFEASGFYYS